MATWFASLSRTVTPAQIDFDRFFETHADAVYGYVLHVVGNPDRAADIAQDTFIKAYRQLGSLTDAGAARTWLFRIASRTAIDEIRRRRWTHPFGPAEFDRPDPALGPEGQAMSRRLDERLQRSLLRLKPAQRQCLLLSDVYDMAATEIASVMDLSPGAVRTLLCRARGDMRRLLAEEGLTR